MRDTTQLPSPLWGGTEGGGTEELLMTSGKSRGSVPSPAKREQARTMRKNMTECEAILWAGLRRGIQLEGSHFRRQVIIGPYIADFCCYAARLVIEVDGEQHGYDEIAAQDARRDAYIKAQGFRILRFSNHLIRTELASVLETIWVAVQDNHFNPHP